MPDPVFRSDMTVELIDHMGDDRRVVRAARVSTGTDLQVPDEAYDTITGLIRYLMKNRHGCYDSATDVLTRSGWKRWPDVDGSEEFATLNLHNGDIEYQKAERLVRKPSEGPMIRIKANGVDLLVTPGHNMVGATRTRGTSSSWNPPTLIPAEQFMDRSHRLSSGEGTWRKGLIHCPEAAEILGFIVADGNVNGNGFISFNFGINTDKAAWLRYRWQHGLTEGAPGRVYLTKVPENFTRLAAGTYRENGRDRCFPQALLEEGDAETLTALLNGYLRGDGSVSPSGKHTFSTTSRAVIDGVQELALKTGFGAVEFLPDTKRAGTYGTKPLYRGTLLRNRNSRPRIGWTATDRAREVTIEQYCGDIHCVTVPNGTLYVRRNGKPVWSGNSPFEKGVFEFRIECPVFVAREFMRHRIASYNETCLSGDTVVTRLSKNHGDTQHKKNSSLAVLWRNWHEGVPDTMGRTRLLSSCRSIYVRSYDEQTLEAKKSKVADIKKNGIQTTYLVTTESGRKIRTTMSHWFFTPTGWYRLEDLEPGFAHVYRSGMVREAGEPVIPPRLRQGIQIWTTQQKQFIVPQTGTNCYLCCAPLTYKEAQLDHVIPVVKDLTRALDITNIKPACKKCHRLKTNGEQIYTDRRGCTSSLRADRIVSVSDPREEETYDLVLEDPHHNFLGNGLVVHNSGRYRQLDPVFWIPAPTRPLVQEGKPGAYIMKPGTLGQYNFAVESIQQSCRCAYGLYQEMLSEGICREVARAVLPASIYTSFYVTVNARSLMNFLSLRVDDPDAAYPSKPQYEIENVAEKMEVFFSEKMPLTYRAFIEARRVAP